MELTAELKAALGDITGKFMEFKGAAQKDIDALKATIANLGITETKDGLTRLQTALDQLRAEMLRPGSGGGTSQPERKSVAQQMFDSEVWREFKERCSRGLRAAGAVEIKTLYPNAGWFGAAMAAAGEEKTTITTTAVGRSTPGILVPQRVPGIVPAARRQLRIRDLLQSRPATGDAVEFIRENVFTNAASPQTEASDKAESALTFTIAHEHIRTIAHWIPATRQVLDDFVELQRYVEDTLLYGLALKEETEILSGDNLGDHLNGLTTQAAAYAGTYNVASDTRLDRLNWAILELEDGDEEPDFMVLNPVDHRRIMAIKTEDGGANTGSYIVGDPGGALVQVPTIWGLPAVRSNSIASGKFLVGNSRFAAVYDRMAARVDISTEHSDYFIKNMVAIRAEERVALAVFRTGAFIYGSF